MKITRAVVPSLFTTLNIFCGFLAIMNASQGKIEMAAWFVILAAIFDSLDGVMARITRSSSKFGVELDSLADVVSFGAAPAFMVYRAHLSVFDNWGILIASLPLIFGAIRLARFNVQLVGFDKDHFSGLPIPAQAITLSAFLLDNYSDGLGMIGAARDALAPLVILLSFLMVSHVRYETLPKLTKRDITAYPWRVVGFGVAALIVIFSKGQYLFLVLFAFICIGLIRSGYQSIRRWGLHLEKEADEESEVSSIDV